MPEWWHTLWSYRLDDLLPFSPLVHARLFERVNREIWPAALVAATLPVLLAASLPWRHRAGPPWALALLAPVLLALASATAAELHLRQSLAQLTGVALAWAAAFAVQALAAAGLAIRTVRTWRAPARTGAASADTARPPAALPSAAAAPVGPPPAGHRAAQTLAALLAGLALLWPLTAPLMGRPLWQAQVFGLAPDPTVLGWLAWLALAPLRGRAWLALAAVPLGWSVFGGLMGAAMGSPTAAVLPAAGAAVLALRVTATRLRRRPPRQQR